MRLAWRMAERFFNRYLKLLLLWLLKSKSPMIELNPGRTGSVLPIYPASPNP
jgi:uncharacterized membrane protein